LSHAIRGTAPSSGTPGATLLGYISEGVGASRWVLATRDGGKWRTFASEPSPRDDLLAKLAADIDAPLTEVMESSELGDTGSRLLATGVTRLLVVARGTGDGSSVAFFEDPDKDGGDLARSAAVAAAPRLTGIARDALEIQRRADALQILRRWLPALDELSQGELDDASGIELLGNAGGWTSLTTLRRTRVGVKVSNASQGKGGRWRQRVKEVEGELPTSAAADRASLKPVMVAAGVKMSGDFRVGRAPDGSLLLAVEDGDASSSLLDTCATILAFASDRSTDSSALRSNAMLQERSRIASVIHEGITQVLTNVTIQMEVLEQLINDPDAARTLLKSLRQAVLEALDSLRGAILELNPTSREWTDLSGGLERFVQDFASQWGMTVSYATEGDARTVDPEVIAVVFGFVQEALTNVRKHADGAPSRVLLRFNEAIHVCVADEGPGFDPNAGEEPGFRLHQGLGLTRARISLAGGRFAVESAPSQGTTLNLDIPG
jgi:signal transduction histidine kinase